MADLSFAYVRHMLARLRRLVRSATSSYVAA